MLQCKYIVAKIVQFDGISKNNSFIFDSQKITLILSKIFLVIKV